MKLARSGSYSLIKLARSGDYSLIKLARNDDYSLIKLSRQWRDNYKKNSSGKDLMRKVSFEDKELNETVVVRKFRTTTQHGAREGKLYYPRKS